MNDLPAKLFFIVVFLNFRDGRGLVWKVNCGIIGKLDKSLADEAPLIALPLEAVRLNHGGDSLQTGEDGKYATGYRVYVDHVKFVIAQRIEYSQTAY